MSLYLDPLTQVRSASVLVQPQAKSRDWVFGLVVTLIVHVVLPLATLAVVWVGSQTGLFVNEPPELPPIEHVAQARFVRRGELPDPNRLPDRQVPVLPQAPLNPTDAPSLNPTDSPPPPPNPNRQPDAVNALDQVLGRADAFAEAERRRLEGDPEGVDEGTERSSEGDLYLGRLYSFFRRGWTNPVTISADEAQVLRASAVVTIGLDLRIQAFRIGTSSGNALFDSSIEEQLQRLQLSGATIPPPPEEEAARYLGQRVVVNFSGRQG